MHRNDKMMKSRLKHTKQSTLLQRINGECTICVVYRKRVAASLREAKNGILGVSCSHKSL